MTAQTTTGGTKRNWTPYIIGGLIILTILGFLLFGLSQGGEIPTQAPKTSPPPPPPAADPRGGVWATGQKIQGEPLETGTATAPVPFAVKPSPYTPGQLAKFTMSFDIFTTGDEQYWRNIFAHSPSGDDGAPRAPSVYLSGTVDAPPARRVHYNFHKGDGASREFAASITSTNTVPLNKWYNITITNDGSKAQVYMNGTKDDTATFTGTFTWPSSDDPWSWHNSRFGQNTSLKVANVYFWNSVLTDTQIAMLSVPTAADPNVPTTSYYSVEPYEP